MLAASRATGVAFGVACHVSQAAVASGDAENLLTT
jgi:hypothetical protein